MSVEAARVDVRDPSKPTQGISQWMAALNDNCSRTRYLPPKP